MLDSIAHSSSPTAATATPSLRPYSKRQQIMQELMGDSDLLLKDRLEVRHVMSRNPVTIQPATTIEEMSKLISDLRLHPVCAARVAVPQTHPSPTLGQS